jgi:hypothetical protein
MTANRRKSSVRLAAHALVQEISKIPLSTSAHAPNRNRSGKPFFPEPEALFGAVCGCMVRLFIVFSVLVVFAVMVPVPASAG